MKLVRITRYAAVLVGLTALANDAAAITTGMGGQYLCPDDGFQPTIASNMAGSSPKTLTVDPKANSDEQFSVWIYVPDNPYTPEDELDIIEVYNHEPGYHPPMPMPPGTKAAMMDLDNPSDTKSPQGTTNLS